MGGDKAGKGAPAAPSVDTKVSPLTGLKQAEPPANPLFLVKIENTGGGEPQTGLNQADLVIEQLVEGGATRLAALFYSKMPTQVGHVRSARTTDIGLAEPVGATIVASGGAGHTLDAIKSSGLQLYTYDMDSPGWSADPDKSAPYHVLWDLKKLAETAKPGTIKNHYFVWGDGPSSADVTKKTTTASVQFSPATTTNWRFSGGKWEPTTKRTAPGQEYKADTLVVIFVRVTDAGYNDAAGNPVPESVVEGTGDAVIFSGDTATEATWSKSGLDGVMSFKSKATGKPVTLKPGHVWLEAAPRGGDVTY
jgi:hypothetical protein